MFKDHIKIANHTIWLLFFVLTIFCLNAATAAGAHEHGQAHMNIAMDDQDLFISVTLAAFDVVGFEHQPKTEEETQSIEATIANLSSTSKWIIIGGGECVEQSSEVANPFAQKKSQSEHHHPDFEISVEVSCKKPQEISKLTIKLAQIYSQIQDIKIEWLVHNKQGLTHLHRNEEEVRFK